MKRLACLAVLACLSACATVGEMEKKGFTTEFLLAAEQADWGESQGVWDWPTRARNMKVPVDARPIAIRELKCRRSYGLYDCDYLIDYGRDGRISGTYEKRHELIGKDEAGKWSIGWIVVT